MSKISLKLCKFSTESPFNSLNLDLGKMCVHAVIHFWLKSGNFAKKSSGNPVVMQWKDMQNGTSAWVMEN